MEQRRHAHSPGIVPSLAPLFIPFKFIRHGLETVLQAARGDVEPHGSYVIWNIAVYQPELAGIHTGGLGQLVKVALNGPCGLGISVSPHGLAVGIVGIDDLGFKKNIGDPVK